MTFQEAHEKLDVIIDKHDLSWFEPEEKDVFLNLAQQEFVNQRYSEFEINEKRRQDIRTLVTTQVSTGNTITIPNDMLYVLSVKGEFIVTSLGQNELRETSIRPIQHDDVNKIIHDPFNKPTNFDPVYITNSNEIAIKCDSAASNVSLVYIKEPIAVDGTNTPNGVFDTPSYTHNEIINIAVRKMLGSIEQQNYDLQVNEIQNQE